VAIVDDTAPQKKGPSLVMQIALLLGLTVVALGIGWGSGMYLTGQMPSKAASTPAAGGGHGEEAGGHGEDAGTGNTLNLIDAHEQLGVVYLEPLTTNLAGPTGTWVRVELALVFDGEKDAAMALQVQQDILDYLRTVKIHQIEGASGFRHLKTDLEERAALRSEGKVKGVFIRTLLFE
jgi:flagellar FliL protein